MRRFAKSALNTTGKLIAFLLLVFVVGLGLTLTGMALLAAAKMGSLELYNNQYDFFNVLPTSRSTTSLYGLANTAVALISFTAAIIIAAYGLRRWVD